MRIWKLPVVGAALSILSMTGLALGGVTLSGDACQNVTKGEANAILRPIGECANNSSTTAYWVDYALPATASMGTTATFTIYALDNSSNQGFNCEVYAMQANGLLLNFATGLTTSAAFRGGQIFTANLSVSSSATHYYSVQCQIPNVNGAASWSAIESVRVE